MNNPFARLIHYVAGITQARSFEIATRAATNAANGRRRPAERRSADFARSPQLMITVEFVSGQPNTVADGGFTTPQFQDTAIMQTHQIPVEQWQPFLDQFSNQHKGDRVDLELLGGGAAPTSRLCNQPLVGVVAVQERDRDARIDVVAGDQHHPQTHSIRHPAQMTVTQRDDGYPVALQIATNDGAVVSLRFEPEGRNSPYQPPEAFLG